MKFFSTEYKAPDQGFREAVIKGLAPDNGLYFPRFIPTLGNDILSSMDALSPVEIGFHMMRPFVSADIGEEDLYDILGDTLTFDIPVVKVSEQIHTLELFHGPTLAFKDIGARFMSRCLGQFIRGGEKVTVLVATSGDTGSAVANGFLGVEGVQVIVLYPRGKVSKIQEKQFATLGENITAIAVEGVFDDCQKLVKTAFLDADLSEKLHLSSANSINLARWLPQSIYFALLVPQLSRLAGAGREIVVSVPSGNFGNLTAGILAQRMGIPINRFIAATNANDVVPEFLETGIYRPRPSVQTVANAMDVGDPSNFSRLLELYAGNLERLREDLRGYHYDDGEILRAIKEVSDRYGYTLDPHGATGYLSLVEDQLEKGETGVFIETAHPAKFGEIVGKAIGRQPEVPERLRVFAGREIVSTPMENDFQAFKEFLLS